MRVLSVQPVTTKKFRIVTEGQLAFVLYKSELSRYGIEEDQEIREEAFDEIMNQLLPLRAKKYAMNLLVKADRTEKELMDKLKKAGYPEDIAALAMDYVKSFGYINDERYAKQYFETFQDRHSVRQLTWKLQQKGISKELAERVLEDCEVEDTEEIIRNLVEKRLRSRKISSDKEMRNLAAYLGRRGFSGEEVWRVLKSYDSRDERLYS